MADLEVVDAYDGMEAQELAALIDDGIYIKELLDSRGWKILQEAFGRVVAQAQREIAKVDPNDTVKIIEYQQIIKLYGSIIPSLVSSLRQEGDVAFDKAKERGMIDKIVGWLKMGQ